ncbi:MAG: prepilin peptidase [Eubacterium sp.]|nr:prepilin peptidase [Eubacterium sp.]
MITIICEITVSIYLLIMAIIDFRKKAIPLLPGVICLLAVSTVLLVAGTGVLSLAMGVLIGALLYGISRISRGGLGQADALVYAVTGAVLGFYKNLELLLVSLILAALIGLFLLVVKKVGRKYRMPFVPFTFIAYGMVIFL